MYLNKYSLIYDRYTFLNLQMSEKLFEVEKV